jgi:NAD(P)-dependent dehydrogenase (short-subunit alcohol dehydrogenase family)
VSASASAGRLAGRVALITGAGRGFGRTMAVAFAREGADVVVNYNASAGLAKDVVAEIEALGRRALAVQADVAREDQVRPLVERTLERFGRLDIVVNNAANALRQDLGQFTEAAWEKSYAVNLRGPIFLVQAALPHLEKSPCAAVVNVISAGAFLPSPFQAMYGAAKAALLHFTRSMANEFAPRGIRVNALAPGTVDTDMVRNNTPEMQRAMAAASPMRRAAHPDEMVGPALFLVSDAASFVTGQVVIADGGLVSH